MHASTVGASLTHSWINILSAYITIRLEGQLRPKDGPIYFLLPSGPSLPGHSESARRRAPIAKAAITIMRARCGALASALHLIRPRRAMDMMLSAGRVPRSPCRGNRALHALAACRRIARHSHGTQDLPSPSRSFRTHIHNVTLGNTFLPKRGAAEEIYCSRLNCAT